ncbi:MAG: nitrite reductase small subunit NirD [Gammaproteobacteria bacterium]|nr:nitrite reductase small subunit NirD [Gammaproteobacteria bacterium]
MTDTNNSKWQTVCNKDELLLNAGICALIQGMQIAVFYFAKQQHIYAVQNYDPYSKANVLSRGIIGDLNGQPVVASPIYKQHFNLQTGKCLEDEAVTIQTYPIRIVDDQVEIAVATQTVTSI